MSEFRGRADRTLLGVVVLLTVPLALPGFAAGRPPVAEATASGWALQLDDDGFTGHHRDQDYTGGIALTLTGARAADSPWSLQGPLRRIDELTRLGRLDGRSHPQQHALRFGTILFTPKDLRASAPIEDDRPYASLLFMSNTEETLLPERGLAVRTSLLVGALGLELAESLHRGIHRVIGDITPRGWDNQISDGGELTARYAVAVRKSLVSPARGGTRFGLSASASADIGYSTGFGIGLSWRWGPVARPESTFAAEPFDSPGLGTPLFGGGRARGRGEFYALGGLALHYRVYDALLEGQFRDSRVEFGASALERWVGDAWLGVAREFDDGLRLTVYVRKRTALLDLPGARSPVWGGIALSRSFGATAREAVETVGDVDDAPALGRRMLPDPGDGPIACPVVNDARRLACEPRMGLGRPHAQGPRRRPTRFRVDGP